MKKTFALFLCIFLLLTAVGCGQNAPESNSVPTAGTTVPGTSGEAIPMEPEITTPSDFQEPMSAISMPLVNEIETASDGTVLFTYTYQNIYLILQDPDVANAVVLDLLNRIDATRSAADSIHESVQADYALSAYWTPYFYQVIYSPMRIDQGVLSLYGTQISYNGSPHPSHVSVSANYDLTTGNALYFGGILSEDYSAEQLCQLIEDALEPQATALYSYYTEIVGERYSGDITSLENWYFSETGLCIYFSPYDIAPYSAGTILVELPYEKLNGILKDDYFPDERAVSGSIAACLFQDADHSQITQYAELILDSDGTQFLLLPEGTVYDIRIELGNWDTNGDRFTPEATVFAAGSLSTGDAVMVQAFLPDTLPNLRLTYHTEDEEVSVFVSQSGKDESILLLNP